MLEHVALYRYIVKTVLCEGGGAEMHPAYIRLCIYIYIYSIYVYIFIAYCRCWEKCERMGGKPSGRDIAICGMAKRNPENAF